MLRTTAINFFVITALSSFNPSAGAAEKEQDISLDKVPAAACQAAEKAVPTAQWNAAEKKKTHAGQVVYEICGTDKDRKVEVETHADGKLVEVEVQVGNDQVPDVVRNALQTRFPRFKTDEVSAVTRKGQVDGYEFEGQNKDGKEVEVFVSGDGKTLKIDEYES